MQGGKGDFYNEKNYKLKLPNFPVFGTFKEQPTG